MLAAAYLDHARHLENMVTIETKIRQTNIGYAMLKKFGWKDGQGLGVNGDGGYSHIRGCSCLICAISQVDLIPFHSL